MAKSITYIDSLAASRLKQQHRNRYKKIILRLAIIAIVVGGIVFYAIHQVQWIG